MNVNDPMVQTFIAGLRSALATYDRENARAVDRHSDECPCAFCHFVRGNREVIAAFDNLDPQAITPKMRE